MSKLALLLYWAAYLNCVRVMPVGWAHDLKAFYSLPGHPCYLCWPYLPPSSQPPPWFDPRTFNDLATPVFAPAHLLDRHVIRTTVWDHWEFDWDDEWDLDWDDAR